MSIRSTKSARTGAHSSTPTSSAEAPRRRPTTAPTPIADRAFAQLKRFDRARTVLPPELAETVDRAIDVLAAKQTVRAARGAGPDWLELGGHGRALARALRREHERTNDTRCSSLASGVEAIAGVLVALAKIDLAGVDVAVRSECCELDGSTSLRIWIGPLSHRQANAVPALEAESKRARAKGGRHAGA